MKTNQFFYAVACGILFFFSCKNNKPVVSSEDKTLQSSKIWTPHNAELPDDLNIKTYDSYYLDTTMLKEVLIRVNKKDPRESTCILPLPNPNGTFSEWQLALTSTMSEELMAKFPDLRTYQGINTEKFSEKARLEWTGQGFTAQLTSNGEKAIIQPLPGSKTVYICYYAKNLSLTKQLNELSQPK